MEIAIILFVAMQIVCALVGTALGEEIGRARRGAIFGLCFGPLGLLIVLACGRTPAAQAEYERAVERARLLTAEASMRDADEFERNWGPRDRA